MIPLRSGRYRKLGPLVLVATYQYATHRGHNQPLYAVTNVRSIKKTDIGTSPDRSQGDPDQRTEAADE